MSKAQLKKYLFVLNKEQIIEVILELYDVRKEAKEYLEFYLNSNEDEKLKKYKRIICGEFFPKRGEPKCRFNVCRKAISEFKKLKPHPACLANLMLYCIETGCEMTSMYGDVGAILYYAENELCLGNGTY